MKPRIISKKLEIWICKCGLLHGISSGQGWVFQGTPKTNMNICCSSSKNIKSKRNFITLNVLDRPEYHSEIIMNKSIPDDADMNLVFKDWQQRGIQMIPANHENHQMAIAIGTPDKHTKFLVTFEKFE